MMNYRGVVYRPPVEARTLLLPVTEGCSHNSCTFCSMYSGVPFRMLALSEVEEYLREIAGRYGEFASRVERIYLVGADPFVLSAGRLEERAALIRKYLPAVKTITMYARVSNIMNKSDDDLFRLRDAGINDLYVGTECGLDDVLERLSKGNSVDDARTQCLRLNMAGINHRDLLMLGTAGKGRGEESALASAKLENEIKPTMLLVNTMTAFEGTPLDKEIHEGTFIPASEKEILCEEKLLLESLNLPNAYFWAVHPLDSARIEGFMRDKDEMLSELSAYIERSDEFTVQRVSRRGTL